MSTHRIHVTAASATFALALLAADLPAQQPAPPAPARVVPVDVGNFTRAESDVYFARIVRAGGFGKLVHERRLTAIDKQDVVRMSRDFLYSSGVFDLEAGPVTVTLPNTRGRFMSLLPISQDHYAPAVMYAPGRFTFTKEKVGTRYVFLLVRTFANPGSPADLNAAHRAQDAIRVQQASAGRFDVPNWDPQSQSKVRAALTELGATLNGETTAMFGNWNEVDPVRHLIATATGWGGNPRHAAVYYTVHPQANDGKTVHRLTLKDVPVDGIWSVSVYNRQGYFEKNELDAYSWNNHTARANRDGSFTIQFGGCGRNVPNCLPITPDWNYTVRLYRPHQEVIEGKWKPALAQPVK